jgi:RNA polymerase primary sigma factor
MRQLKISKQITNREHKSLDKYLQEIGTMNMVTAEEEVDLAVRIREGDERALQLMVNANLRFVVSVAKQYQNQGLPLGDLINEGNLGLIKAAQRFDETRGFKFISYAVWWIRQSIMQALAEQGRLIRLPLNRLGMLTKINRAAAQLEQKYEREPTSEEISRLLEMEAAEVESFYRAAGRHVSLDAPIPGDDETSLLSVMENVDEPDPDHLLLKESLRNEIKGTLEVLGERERRVICFFYGINGCNEMSLEEISFKMNLSRERVRQIKEKAIKRLKACSRIQNLKIFLG